MHPNSVGLNPIVHTEYPRIVHRMTHRLEVLFCCEGACGSYGEVHSFDGQSQDSSLFLAPTAPALQMPLACLVVNCLGLPLFLRGGGCLPSA